MKILSILVKTLCDVITDISNSITNERKKKAEVEFAYIEFKKISDQKDFEVFKASKKKSLCVDNIRKRVVDICSLLEKNNCFSDQLFESCACLQDEKSKLIQKLQVTEDSEEKKNIYSMLVRIDKSLNNKILLNSSNQKKLTNIIQDKENTMSIPVLNN